MGVVYCFYSGSTISNSKEKSEEISTALNSFCFRSARIVLGLLLLFPFWAYCLFGLGLRGFFHI